MKNHLKTIFFILFFFLLFLFQTSFAVRLGISSWFLYVIFLSLFLLIFFEDSNRMNNVVLAFFVGLMWDFFSSRPLGFHFLILGLTAYAIKVFLKKYVHPISPRL
jgi:rod shape-determining protein MreD